MGRLILLFCASKLVIRKLSIKNLDVFSFYSHRTIYLDDHLTKNIRSKKVIIDLYRISHEWPTVN